MNKHLQVEGYENVYAVGDCTNLKEPKTAYAAGLHAGVAVNNIAYRLAGKAQAAYHPGNVITHYYASHPFDHEYHLVTTVSLHLI